MDVPPEIAFRNIEATDDLKGVILDKIDDLEEVYPELVSCRVMVEETNSGRQSGHLNHVRLDLSVPGKEVVVNRDPPKNPASQDLTQAINEAFDIATRQLRELKQMQRGHVKTHDLPPHGRVVKLLTDEHGVRYGFLMSSDGRQIYFHENALSDDLDYEELEIGSEVRFAAAEGDKGPQASTVARLDRDKIGPTQEEEFPLGGEPA